MLSLIGNYSEDRHTMYQIPKSGLACESMRHSQNYDLWRVETKLESYVFWCNQCKILMLEASFCCKMLERDKLTHYLTDIRERETPFR